jgi:hypothetical protein
MHSVWLSLAHIAASDDEGTQIDDNLVHIIEVAYDARPNNTSGLSQGAGVCCRVVDLSR